jgi:hypothetical protein
MPRPDLLSTIEPTLKTTKKVKSTKKQGGAARRCWEISFPCSCKSTYVREKEFVCVDETDAEAARERLSTTRFF